MVVLWVLQIGEEETGAGAKVKKSDLIREKQEAKRQETGLDKDEEKINNVLKKAKHSTHTCRHSHLRGGRVRPTQAVVSSRLC